MHRPAAWSTSAARGFARSCAFAAAGLAVPAVWAAAAALCAWWGHPGTWIAPIVFAALATFALARPIARAFRGLTARWTGTVVADGYREAPEPVRLSTGYWWNGYGYARTAQRSREEQRWRHLLGDPATWRDLRFLPVAALAAVVAAFPVAAPAIAVAAFGAGAPYVAIPALLAAVASAPYAWRSGPAAAVRFLRPSRAMSMAGRVEELTAQRADATVAQAAEIRRIERDLHDGAQARLVGLGLSLATAEKLMDTDPLRAKALLRDARAGAATSLSELRDLVRGINPPVLNERGLVDAVRALALDAPIASTVHAPAELRLDPPIESAVYFGIAELLTNAAKHAHAENARISLVRNDSVVVVHVEDDGRGGADARPGGGLDGLRRRLAAFDGGLEIDSPPGGPTRVRMEVPCA